MLVHNRIRLVPGIQRRPTRRDLQFNQKAIDMVFDFHLLPHDLPFFLEFPPDSFQDIRIADYVFFPAHRKD